jgi:hypothetical protein
MSIRIVVNLKEDSADVLTIYGAGAKVYLDSAATEGGAYSNVTSTTVVSGTEQYELTDAAGTSATWYKVRTGDSGGSSYSSYSDAFQATAWAAYATVDELEDTMDVPTGAGSSRRRNLLAQLLLDAKDQTDADCARTFLRVPQVSGDVTVYCDIEHAGYASLVSAIGHPYTIDGRALDILSVTTLEVRDSESGAYAAIASGDTGYYLDVGSGSGPDWPYQDVTLSPASSRTTWPTGRRAVKITGALGFSAVPSPVKRANIDLAREAYRQSVGGGPAQVGTNQFGTPVYLTGKPDSYKALLRQGSVFLKRSWRTV